MQSQLLIVDDRCVMQEVNDDSLMNVRLGSGGNVTVGRRLGKPCSDRNVASNSMVL